MSDFHQDGDEATIRQHEKGEKRRTIGLHYAAASAIAEYIEKAGITSGPLFRSRLNSISRKLADRAMKPVTVYLLIERYLGKIAVGLKRGQDGAKTRTCIYTPHSLGATTATLPLDAGVDIWKVQELLGHRHFTTTQIYVKRRRSTSESASHDVPI